MAKRRVFKYIISWLGSMFEVIVVEDKDDIRILVSYLPEYVYQIEYRLRDGRESLQISTAVTGGEILDRDLIDDFLRNLNEMFNECVVLGEEESEEETTE